MHNSRAPMLTISEKIGAYFTVAQLPFVIIYNVLFRMGSVRHRGRPLPRVILNSAVRFLMSHVTYRQQQYLTPGTHATYLQWAKASNLPPTTEDLDHDAQLMWVGPKRTDRVLVYCHGGAFMACILDAHLSLCRKIQEEFASRSDGQEIGVAVLHYSLFPNTFPTQLNQLMAAVGHLLANGVQPSNLHLIGDSAGANLILQLISHTLHPLDSIPPSPLTGKGAIGSACLISPWTALTGDTGSHEAHKDLDVVQLSSFKYWGGTYMKEIPESQLVYVQANTAPAHWFDGVEGLVGRVLVTAGGDEMLRDDIVELSAMLTKVHPDVRLDVQEGGLHDDPIFELAAGVKELGPTTDLIVEWLVEGCRSRSSETL